MNKNKIGITSANGYPFLSFKERFAIYQKVGFNSIMLWWGEGEKETRKERVALAKEYDLQIENVHAEMEHSNSLWKLGSYGEQKTTELIEAMKDCNKYELGRMVIHLTNGDSPPDISEIGLKRIELLIENAIKYNIVLAIENVRTDKHVKYVLDNYNNKHIAFCYDTGHANIWCKETDWLSMYSNRLVAVHLHDNNGIEDEHTFPCRGTIAWAEIIKIINNSPYDGCLALETEYQGSENTEQLAIFLNKAYQSGIKLAKL